MASPATQAANSGAARAGNAAGRFDALDSLRGLSALLVAAYHFNPAAYSHAGSVLHNAYLAVDFFFVLSGFVIAHSYAETLGRSVGFKDFALRRLIRLYPLHLLAILPFLCVELARLAADSGFDRAPFTDTRSLPSLLANLLLVQGLGVSDQLTWNGPSWSISTEFWTYLIFAAVVLWGGYRNLKALAAMIAAAALIALVWLAPATLNVTYDFGLLRCLAGFFTGVLVRQLLFARPSARPATGNAALATGLEFLAIALCVAFVAYAGAGRLSLAAPLVFAALVAVFASGRGQISAWLCRPAFLWLGAISYPLYMVHAFMVYAINTVAKFAAARGFDVAAPFAEDGRHYLIFQLPSRLAMDGATLVFLAIAVGVAGLAYSHFDVPVRRALTRWVNARDEAPVPARPLAGKVVT